MNAPVLAWLFTHTNHQQRHHFMELETSIPNYACNGIVWDRLFGTYTEAAVEQTGIGPIQPRIRGMFLLPVREPGTADTVASHRHRDANL